MRFASHLIVMSGLRAAIVLGLALAAMPLLRRAPSATRRLLLAISLAGALAIPALSTFVPSVQVLPGPITAPLHGFVVPEPLIDGPALQVGVPSRKPTTTAPRAATAWIKLDRDLALASLWALGAFVVLARMLIGVVLTRRIVRRASPACDWAAAVRRAETTTGLRAEVRMTSDADGPALTGILAPTVLVPRGSHEWTDERRYSVLLHELAHVRQRDCLTQVLSDLATAVYWFNPLVWIAAAALRVERELAADDAVLTAGTRATSYADDLVAIAQSVHASRAAPSGALAMAQPSQLTLRVLAIVSADRVRRPLDRVRAWALSACLGALVLAIACTSPEAAIPARETLVGPPLPAHAASEPASEASSIDPRLQTIAEEELDRVFSEWQPAAGTVLVLNPSTGEVLANAGRARSGPADVALGRAYVTGSTLKAFTLAGALEEGVLSKTERIDCEHGAWSPAAYRGRTIHDNGSYGALLPSEMLAVSSNIGFSKVFDRLGGTRLEHWLRVFHFGAAPEVTGAAAGWMPDHIEDRSFPGASVAMGESLTASPLQMAAAYAALANEGEYVSPTIARRKAPAAAERVLTAETARTVVSMLEEVVQGEKGTGTLARVSGVRVAGKTGTAGWDLPGGGEGRYSSFVGIVPSTAPRFVILVGVEQPRDEASGGAVAAPAFARVATRALRVAPR